MISNSNNNNSQANTESEACPGCGAQPGEGINPTCNHPAGCGYWQAAEGDDDACPGCGWTPGDGINPNCNHDMGCGFWKAEAEAELKREREALKREGLSY